MPLKERLSCSLCLGLEKNKKTQQNAALLDSQAHVQLLGPWLMKLSAVCTELSALQRAPLLGVFYRNGSKLLASIPHSKKHGK